LPSRVLAIAANTFREVIRQPVYGIILFAALCGVAFSPAVASFTLMEDIRMLKDIGLATLLMAGLFLSGFSAGAVLRRETENMTAATVLSKPVGRGTFVLAKYLGIVAALAVASYLVLVMLVLTVRMGVPERATWRVDYVVFLGEAMPFLIAVVTAALMNYFQRRPFVSTAVLLAVPLYTMAWLFAAVVDRTWSLTAFGATLDGDTAVAGVLVFLAVTVLASVALAASTRLSTVASIVLCLGVLFAGMLSDYMFGRSVREHLWGIRASPAVSEGEPASPGRDGSGASSPGRLRLLWARVGYAALPNFQTFWMADALSEDNKKGLPIGYLGRAAGYAAFYQAAMLCLAAMLFTKREGT
jgi:hypothetical protein